MKQAGKLAHFSEISGLQANLRAGVSSLSGRIILANDYPLDLTKGVNMLLDKYQHV